ncbi:unnamed protein product [Caretta caretta]
MMGPPATCCQQCCALATGPRVGWGEHHPGGPAGPPQGAALHLEPKRHAAVTPQHPLLSSSPLIPLSYTARDLTTAQVRPHPDTWVPAIPTGRRVLGVGQGGGFWGEGWVPENGVVGWGRRSQGVRDVV